MTTTTFQVAITDLADQMRVRRKGVFTATANALLTAGWPFMNPAADARLYVGDEVFVESGTAPDTNPNGIQTYSPSAGTFVPAQTYTTKPDATAQFSIIRKSIPVAELKDGINRALMKRSYEEWYPLTIIDDGDMETSGVTNWAASSVTRSKITTAADVLFGPQSLSVTLTGSGGEARSNSVYVEPLVLNTYLMWAIVRADIGTAKLVAYDVTNGADIASVSWTHRGFGLIGTFFQLPSTCELMRIALRGVNSSDVGVWNRVGVLPVGATLVNLPTWFEVKHQVRRLYRYPMPGDSGSPFMGNPRLVSWGRMQGDQSAAGSTVKLQIPPVTGPLWVVARRPYPVLSALTDTTFMPRHWLGRAAKYELLDALVNTNRGDPDAAHWQTELERTVGQIAKLDSALNGQPMSRIGE